MTTVAVILATTLAATLGALYVVLLGTSHMLDIERNKRDEAERRVLELEADRLNPQHPSQRSSARPVPIIRTRRRHPRPQRSRTRQLGRHRNLGPVMSADTPDAGLTERETVDAILTLLPMSDDGTGHVADCGYTHEAPTCDCYDLPLRIAEAVAARVAAERERADAALGQIARQIEAIPTETAIERPGHGGYIRSLRGPGNVRTDALRIVRAALGDTPPGGDR